VERQTQLLEEFLAIERDKDRVWTTLGAVGVTPRPWCAIPEIPEVLVGEIRARLERALAPRKALPERPAAQPAEPAYEPVVA
jgi:hypothetical protein